jgi:hypothetical protein
VKNKDNTQGKEKHKQRIETQTNAEPITNKIAKHLAGGGGKKMKPKETLCDFHGQADHEVRVSHASNTNGDNDHWDRITQETKKKGGACFVRRVWERSKLFYFI